MSKLHSTAFLSASLLALLLGACSAPDTTVYLADYLDDASAGDAMPALRAALRDCAQKKASTLMLPGDRFIFTDCDNINIEEL